MNQDTELHKQIYEGENLRAVAFPLGGIGTGHFCLLGDGGFGQWQIFNQVNHRAYLPGTFMAIRTEGKGEEPCALLLQTPGFQEGSEFTPAPSVSDHMRNEQAKILPKSLPSIKSLRLRGEYPVGQFTYEDDRLPVDVVLSAFCPFIPFNPKDSGLPFIFLIFRVSNQTTVNRKVSLMISLQNAVGWDGFTPISGVSCPTYGGNCNRIIRRGDLTALLMENEDLEAASGRSGQMALACFSRETTARPQWKDIRSLWLDFESDGDLVSGSSWPSPKGMTWNGALSTKLTLEPNESREVIFALAWYFPNRYVNWDQKGLGVEDTKSRFWVGNMYTNWFGGAMDVVDYAKSNMERLREGTESFRSSFFSSSLPGEVLDAVSSQISTIRSPTCFWAEDGRFYGFEGCCGASCGNSFCKGGCCPLNCTHVWNYEQTLSKLFPSLERSMREVDLEFQMGGDGRIPHRTKLPLYLPRWSSDDPKASVYAADGHCGTILKTYREYRVHGDKDFLDRYWESLKRCLDYAINTWDVNEEGVFSGAQWNTYDLHLFGHNSFVSGLYLSALRAMEEMAREKGDEALSERCKRIYSKGASLIDSELWNGEYYIQNYDQDEHPSYQYGKGCHSDQLLGQWWAHILGLGHILDPEHVSKALDSIFRYNLRDDLEGHVQKPRVYLKEDEPGLLICTWPKGGRRDPVSNYSDEVWTGIEYSTASLMIYEDMVEEGLEIVRRARGRHDGRFRNPWNEVECGDHYVRPMSSWALLESLSGCLFDGPRESMAFEPRVNQSSFTSLFTFSNGWGNYRQELGSDAQSSRIEIVKGCLELQELSIPNLLERTDVRATTSYDDLDVEVKEDTLVIRGEIELNEGEALEIRLSL